MEFACGFVYVPQPTNLKSTQQQNQNAPKRSALFPPKSKVRPHSPSPPAHPPPPPPSCKSQEEPTKHFFNNEKKVQDRALVHRNPAFQVKENMDASTAQGLHVKRAPKPSPGPKRKALIPPHMRTQLGRLSPPSSHLAQSEAFPSQDQGLCKEGDKSKSQSFDPDCFGSHQTPGGAVVETSPPNDMPNFKKPERTAWSSSIWDRLPQYEAPKHRSSSFSMAFLLPPLPALVGSDEAPLDKPPLPGNPNVILVSLGKLVTEENVDTFQYEPTTCSHCGSAKECLYDNVVGHCYFCQPWESSQGLYPLVEHQDCLFLLTPETPTDSLLIFCIDIAGSMTAMSEITEEGQTTYKSRLQCVQQAVMQCIQSLNKREPNTRVGLISFNKQLCLHGNGKSPSQFYSGAQLTDSVFLKEVTSNFPDPAPLSECRGWLEREIYSLYSLVQLCSLPLGLENTGDKALGPAVLAAITMASRQPGSKVLICTDGKANTQLGNLDVLDTDTRSLVPSSIFYQDLGEDAVNYGSTVSVVTFEGTDCRLDELGRLADQTGGTVIISSLSRLNTELQMVMERKTVATHCTVTLLLPSMLSVRGEREAGHKVTRPVSNVSSDTEITFQFDAREQDTSALFSAGKVSVQLQVRYRRVDGRTALRILSVNRTVTADSSLVLASLSPSILQLNVSQTSAALAVRGRYRDAQSEGQTQTKIMEMFLDYVKSTEEEKKHREWLDVMDPIFKRIDTYKRTKQISMTHIQALTDAGAALLFGMKNGNRTSVSPGRETFVATSR